MEEKRPPRIINQQFELLERLARSGAVPSWKARRKGEDDPYVVKLIPLDQIPSTEDFDRRFKSIGGLNHAGLMRRHGHLVEGGQMAFWRPFVDGVNGCSLSDAPLTTILNVVQRVAEALHQAHRAGVTHGAVKPENIILNASFSAIVVDFSWTGKTNPAEDVCALGRCLFLWLTGQRLSPADANADEQILAARLKNSLREGLPVPPALGRLVVTMLRSRGARTCASMLEIRDQIDDLRVALKRGRPIAENWDSASFVPATGTAAPAPALAADESDRTTKPGVPMMLTAAAVMVLIVALAAVIRMAPEPEVDVPLAAEKEAAPEPEPVAAPQPPSQYELELMLRQREEAQATLDRFINLQLELEEQQVELWSARRFTAAVAAARQGDEPFRNQQFQEAGVIYSSALGELEQIAALRSIVVAEALERGHFALAQKAAQAAADAFELGLAIEPDNEVAQAGRQRAETLDQALELLAQAEAAENGEDFSLARSLYQDVADLDPLMPRVTEAVGRMDAALADIRFRSAMSRGLDALARGEWDSSRDAFERAKKMRPSDPAPKDGLIELQRRIRDSRVAVSRDLAERAVSQERWEAAVKHFDALLAQDPNLAFAQEGKFLAEERADLDARLQTFTGAPRRWWSDRGRQEASSLLADAGSIENRGPRLDKQIKQLAAQVELANQPVTITLVSDNACDVVVYKVARLGQFQTTSLELMPGRYTAVGTRKGYRDERRVFLVPAGKEPEPVVLRCEDQVLAGG